MTTMAQDASADRQIPPADLSVQSDHDFGLDDAATSGSAHDLPYVQPSSYLRPRRLSPPVASNQFQRVIDREEQQGLVGFLPSSTSLLLVFVSSVSTC